MEQDLYQWIIGIQQQGFPVSREMILVKGNEILQTLYGNLRSTGSIGRGWLDRFMNRHPSLCLRSAQIIKPSRNKAPIEGLKIFFNEILKYQIERKLSPDRIFNMDETRFAQKDKSRNVIAMSGSKNVWSKSIEAQFHLRFIICVYTSGFVIHLLIIAPGQR